MQLEFSAPLQSVFGRASLGEVLPAPPVFAARQAGQGASWSLEDQAFGAAVIRELRRATEHAVYGPDAKVKLSGPGGPKSEGEMSDADKALLDKLKARDSLVRGHEQAHILAAGGQAAGLPQYVYQTGPDGRQYAIGGSVQISVVSSSANPEEAARQAETASRAATANGEMSLADMRTAIQAAALAVKARSRAADAYAVQALQM